MRWNVNLTKNGKKTLSAQLSYIHEQNPNGARRVAMAIALNLQQLAAFPKNGKKGQDNRIYSVNICHARPYFSTISRKALRSFRVTTQAWDRSIRRFFFCREKARLTVSTVTPR